MRIRARAVAFLKDKKLKNRRHSFSTLVEKVPEGRMRILSGIHGSGIHGSGITRVLLIAAIALLALGVTPAHADEPVVKSYQIAAQSVSTALKAFAAQSDMQLIFTESDVGQAQTTGVNGKLPPREALDAILKGTNLEFEFTANNVIVVRKAGSRAVARTSAYRRTSDLRLADADSSGLSPQSSALSPKLAQANAIPTGPEVKQQQEQPKLEEIIVTAQKREERLQDVPVPVTAISADTLVDNNQLRLADYYSSVPGLNLTSDGSGAVSLAIRGITTGTNNFTSINPTVGVTVDDVPYGSSTGLTLGTYPDIDPSNLSRIEVLRGPQGTLYGASSIGGLFKFVTADPSTDGVSGRVQADLNHVYNSAAPGYGVRVAMNAPLGDTVAIRVSGFSRRDAGYIDDPVLHENGVNQVNVNGGRISALWRPSDLFSLKLSAFLQKTIGDGADAVPVDALGQPTLGDLQQHFLLGTGGYSSDVKVYSATFDAGLGRTHLTAISGYQTPTFNQVSDLSPSFYGTFLAPTVYGVSAAAGTTLRASKKFTQEIRWSSSGGQSLDWLLGLFYTHEDSSSDFASYAVNPATGKSVGGLLTGSQPMTYAEYAGFGDLTWHITERFDIQVGGRESHNSQAYQDTYSGPGWALFGLGDPTVQPRVHTKDSAFTYLVTPQWKLDADRMIYVRLASGYRPGGPNVDCTLFPVPCHFGSDKTYNYELGLKGSALDHLISFDASAYYINWKDIQLTVANVNDTFVSNGSSAKSEGIELAADVKPLRGLKISTWVAYNNAVLTSDFPPNSSAAGVSGDRLPFSSRFSGNFSVDDDFPLAHGTTGFFGGSISYIGNRESDFTLFGLVRPTLPSYTKVDLHAGVRYESWKVSLFVNNVADKRGFAGMTSDRVVRPWNIYIQPRTVGLSLSKNF
jgi:outer membrane receptor protein involved in Fe transport